MKIEIFNYMNKISVLYLTPNLNHYKAKQLNLLSEKLDLTLISGTGRNGKKGHKQPDSYNFNIIHVDVKKQDFGKSKVIRKEVHNRFKDFDWVLIPAEKKNIILFVYVLFLRMKHKKTKLFTHSHPISKSGNGKSTLIDRLLTKFFFTQLDCVVFYTEPSRHWAVDNKLILPRKAFWANNTIDNTEIEKHYNFELPPNNQLVILFIGRLISSKRIDDLFVYFKKLKELIPELTLEIIGDGPEQHIVSKAIKEDNTIFWHGTLVDEAKIAPIMKRTSVVFVPGHSGLSINHAFAYGRPYITLQGPSHAPELKYLDEGDNGYILSGDIDSNIKIINELLTNRNELEKFCNKAKQKGNYLTIEKWVEQMEYSLSNAK